MSDRIDELLARMHRGLGVNEFCELEAAVNRLRAELAAEKERCALIADSFYSYAPDQDASAIAAAIRASNAKGEDVQTMPQTSDGNVCDDILRIMETYDEQMESTRGLGTPGGLEHMGDVWRLLDEWRRRINAARASNAAPVDAKQSCVESNSCAEDEISWAEACAVGARIAKAREDV